MTPRPVALALTPLPDAKGLAALCRVGGLHATCAPTAAGAVAVFADAGEEAARAATATLSQSFREVPILYLRRGPSSDPAATDVQAASYQGGEERGPLAPGLVLAELPAEVEDLLLGGAHPADAEGAVRADSLSAWAAARAVTRLARRPRGA